MLLLDIILIIWWIVIGILNLTRDDKINKLDYMLVWALAIMGLVTNAAKRM